MTKLSLLIVALLGTASASAHTIQAVPSVPVTDVVQVAPIAANRAAVRAALAANRIANVARFHAYQTAGVFPSNTFKPGELNVWRDRDGHYCAAATIIKSSGETALVAKVADDTNFIKLADVQQGPLMDWILTSGLTQDELVMIQKPFKPVTERPSVDTSVAVDARMREAETRRLAKLYRSVEAKLVAESDASLDAAADRLLHDAPALAAQLVAHSPRS